MLIFAICELTGKIVQQLIGFLSVFQVTGSGRGIGREICLELAKTGAIVVCWSKSSGPNEEVVKKIRERGGKAYAYTVDVGSRAEVERVALKARRALYFIQTTLA
jgi:NAD(P)-dependent dehydrogenase (short-subunit alcohol dehydrogenase family)